MRTKQPDAAASLRSSARVTLWMGESRGKRQCPGGRARSAGVREGCVPGVCGAAAGQGGWLLFSETGVLPVLQLPCGLSLRCPLAPRRGARTWAASASLRGQRAAGAGPQPSLHLPELQRAAHRRASCSSVGRGFQPTSLSRAGTQNQNLENFHESKIWGEKKRFQLMSIKMFLANLDPFFFNYYNWLDF